ncbi:metallophosphoesterase [Spiractinospora alimapuensis]|uniref:metallophosphoesterase family protein n=1 Tax=Spiractinospora alimapuensis TaxID=2820884 RepID=UPI001F39BD29|nr:metallophosphoesterase [Spiractinospora alimapuensis]QVQ54451.1 metallophosphoesterase [Spiractinospora alimapuensis]
MRETLRYLWNRLRAAGRGLAAGPGARLRDRLRTFARARVTRVVLVLLVGVGGAGVGVAAGGSVTTAIGPADVQLSLRPALQGETVVDVSPLGRLSFDTHTGPLRIDARIVEIRLDAAEEIIDDPDAINRMAESVASEVRDGVIRMGAHALLFGVLGAALAGGVLFRDVRRTAGATAGALVTLGAVGVTAVGTFNANAIAEPRYTGLLAGAPQVVGNAYDVVDRFEEYQEQLAGLVGNVSTLYQVTSTLPVYEEDDESTVRVLHVSDIHLNPAAWTIISSLRDQFQADFIVDSGDLTDRGNPAEDVFADEISDLDVPYVWVRGNHDSTSTQEAVEAQDNAVVLDGEATEIEGLRVYGAGDPRFTPDKSADPGTEDDLTEIGELQAQSQADADPPLDFVVMHDPVQAEPFSGQVPLVLAGHGHRRWEETKPSGTQFLVQGSTGGAGLRGLETGVDSPTPYQASVLYFDRETGRLQARDDIDLGGLGLTSAQIERHVESDPDRDLEPEDEAASEDSSPEASPRE